MEKINRYEPYCGYAEYGDDMEAKMSKELDGRWVSFRDHEQIVKELLQRCDDAYRVGRSEGIEEARSDPDRF